MHPAFPWAWLLSPDGLSSRLAVASGSVSSFLRLWVVHSSLLRQWTWRLTPYLGYCGRCCKEQGNRVVLDTPSPLLSDASPLVRVWASRENRTLFLWWLTCPHSCHLCQGSFAHILAALALIHLFDSSRSSRVRGHHGGRAWQLPDACSLSAAESRLDGQVVTRVKRGQSLTKVLFANPERNFPTYQPSDRI